MSWLDRFFPRPLSIQVAGSPVPTESVLNFNSGFSSTDNAALGRTDLATATVPTPASVTISALSIDWSLTGVFTKTLSAGGNTFTFANTTDGQTIIVILTGAASTVTWPSVKWAGGTPPTQTASGTDVYTFVKAGSTIYGSVVQALS